MYALADAHELAGVGGPVGHRGRRGVADGVAGLEPGLHVGEAVLERLVRGQRTAERVAVERPLDGHVERRCIAPTDSAARMTSASCSWCSTSRRPPPTSPTHRVGRHADVVEAHHREAAGEVDGLHRLERHARGVDGHEHLGEAAVRCGR